MSDNPKSFMLLYGEINEEKAEKIVSWILDVNISGAAHQYLELFIDSCGGCYYSGLSIINAMRNSGVPVRTTCTSRAFSMSAHIFIQGVVGYRRMMRDSCLMFHGLQNSYNGHCPIPQLRALLENDEFDNNLMLAQIEECSSLTQVVMPKDICGLVDRYVRVDEAIRYGLCDIKG